MTKKPDNRPIVKVFDSRYQPIRAELRKDLRSEGTFEDAIKVVVRSVRIQRVVLPMR